MADPCLDFTVVQLRDLARGKIPGFSKMKKRELCDALIKANLLYKEPPIKETVFNGVTPPTWDLDKGIPIPDFLLPYDYIYGAGSSKVEVSRYFILPDNFPLIGVILPSKLKKTPRREFDITIADYYAHYDKTPYIIDGEEITFNIITIKGLRNDIINNIAPPFYSDDWLDLLKSLQVFNIKDRKSMGTQLRREYQIISTSPA